MTHHRPGDERDRHDAAVCQFAREFDREGRYDVAVDGDCGLGSSLSVPSFNTHPPDCGEDDERQPDVYARAGSSVVLVEVETESTYEDERTKCQLSTFAHQDDAEVWVGVPSDATHSMELQLRSWELEDVEVQGY